MLEVFSQLSRTLLYKTEVFVLSKSAERGELLLKFREFLQIKGGDNMSKKLYILTVLVFMCSFLIATPTFAATPNYPYLSSVDLVIGNKSATINGAPAAMDQAAYTKNGRTLVPFRFLAEAIGAQVGWDAKANTASLTLKGSEVKVTLGSKVAYINGKKSVLEVPAESRGGRTFIPLRFVSEALGASVDYDAETRTVSVKLVDTTGWSTFEDPNGGKLIYPTDWKISGDTNTSLMVYSPAGTKMTATLVQTELAKIIADNKSTYSQQGYQSIIEEPIDSTKAESGQMIGFMKMDLANLDNSDVIIIVVVKEAEGNVVFNISTKYAAMNADMEIVNKILSID